MKERKKKRKKKTQEGGSEIISFSALPNPLLIACLAGRRRGKRGKGRGSFRGGGEEGGREGNWGLANLINYNPICERGDGEGKKGKD